MKRIFSNILSIILLWMSCASAQATSLDSCRAQARRNYPLIRQYHLIRLSEAYSVQNAARNWIPKIYITAQTTYQSDAANMSEVWSTIGLEQLLTQMGKDIPDMYMRKFQGKAQIDIQQNIWDGGKSASEKTVAQAEAKADVATAEVDFYNLERRVDNLYFGILLLDEQLTQTDNLIQLLEANLQRAKALYSNHVILQSDVDAVEVEYLTASQRKDQINGSRQAYREMLSLLVGRDLTSEKLERPAALSGVLERQEERPELQLLEAKKEVLTAQENSIRTFSMPQFSAFASGWYGYPTLNMFTAMCSAKWGLSGLVGLKMSWNIPAYYTQSNRINQLELKKQQIDIQRDIFSFNNQLQRTQNNGEVERLSKTLEQDEKIVRLRQSVREAAESQYRNGTITTSDLLQRITDENNARVMQTIHQIEYLKTQYELEQE